MKQVLQTKNLKDEKHEYLFYEINFYFYTKEFTKTWPQDSNNVTRN